MANLVFSAWVVIAMGWNITDSHFNPAVTLAIMFRKKTRKNFQKKIGIAYILFQFGGGIAAAIFCSIISSKITHPKEDEENSFEFFHGMMFSIFASFIYVWIYLTQTEASTRFSKDTAINCLLMAGSYAGVVAMGKQVSNDPVNPATGIGMCIASLTKGNVAGVKAFWIFGAFPFLGAVLAVLFHELVFKKAHDEVNDKVEDDGVMNEEGSHKLLSGEEE
jgi:glycerol uptake facilitator-like aquaporin